jgi:hypothetical protein
MTLSSAPFEEFGKINYNLHIFKGLNVDRGLGNESVKFSIYYPFKQFVKVLKY